MSMYLQPSTREELISALGQLTDKSRIIAGGTDLMPDLRKKRPDVDIFLSLSAMEEMKQIRISDDTICIGAMATHDSIARNAEIKTWATALHHACSHVGSQQIRNRGTIGGSLANASPAGDMIPCVCLLGGTLLLLGADGAFRRIPAEDFTLGVSRTALQTGEVLFAIELPLRKDRSTAFVKLGSRKEVTIAQISIAISWDKGTRYQNPDGYLGAVDVTPVHLEEMPELIGQGPVDDAAKDRLAESLRDRIRGIRMNRKRPPKLKITEAERLYKERAVRSVVYDVFDLAETID